VGPTNGIGDDRERRNDEDSHGEQREARPHVQWRRHEKDEPEDHDPGGHQDVVRDSDPKTLFHYPGTLAGFLDGGCSLMHRISTATEWMSMVE